MTSGIHPLSVVSPDARLAPDVTVGPFTVIGPKVVIGRGTRIGSHAVIEGATEIGEENQIHAGCVIGVDPQIKAAHASGGVIIGQKNILREYVTIHASGSPAGITRVGGANYIMSGVHVAHDCRVGDHTIIANGTQLSGHVEIGDHVFLSGLVGVHQFVRVGEYSIVGGLTKLVTDVIPFGLCDGNPAKVRGANVVGLKRAGFTTDRVQQIKKAIQALYFSGLLRGEALKQLEILAGESADTRRILDFIKASKRGIAPRSASSSAE